MRIIIMGIIMKILTIISLFSLFFCVFGYYNDGEKVRLTDIQTITLHQNRKTTGRRSSPVQQLNCIGGSARYKYKPDAVQCYNRGSDGNDVQWQCKADMPNEYKFGTVEVTCEGYDYPDDPYILKGSCGLEYTIEYTEAGRQNKHNYPNHYNQDKGSSTMSWIVFFVIIGAVVVIIKNMTSGNGESGPNDPRRPPNQPPPYPNHQSGPRGNGPPPYGFKPDYTSDHTQPPPYESTTHTGAGYQTHSDAYGSSRTYGNTRNRTQTQNGGGFWTGMGLGSLAGYMFGSRGNRYGNRNSWYGNNRGWGNGGYHGSSWGSGGGGSSWGSGGSSWGSSGGSSSGSSSSRSASGFGGTKRR